jgi:energy-coupling factor transport system permease protein
LKLPVDDFALMTLLALRFIPTMFDEAEQLIKAQTARGADLTHGTVQQRIQSLFMFFTPLIEGTLRRASDLSVALEARGYRAEGRQTLLHETSFGLADYAVLGTVVLVTVGALLL